MSQSQTSHSKATGWVFYPGNPPREFYGKPIIDVKETGVVCVWAYVISSGKWYKFIDFTGNWQEYDPSHVPKHYLAQLLLLT